MSQSSSKTQEYVQSPELPKSERKLNPRVFIGFIIVAAGLPVWYFLSRPQTEPLQLSGRIEGYETDVGAKVPGRVNFVAIREGDRVLKGQVIVRLDDEEIQAQLRGAKARLAAARQQERQAALQIDVIESQIQEAQINLQQAQGDAKGRIFQAEANVAAVEAQLSQAEAQFNQARAELELASINRNRFAQLVREGATPQQQFDQTQTNFKTAQAILQNRKSAVDAARRQVSAAQGGLTQAQTTAFNPGIRNAQLRVLRKQLIQSRSQQVAEQAEVTNALAAEQEIKSQISYLNIVSPMKGVVTARAVEPGAVVTSGKTLLTLLDQNTVYLRGYIPEGKIGKVRVGQQAKVFLDSAPQEALTAHVAAIDPQASFTPENIYFHRDRVKQVFGVKINIDNPAGFAKPGMPADAEIVTAKESR